MTITAFLILLGFILSGCIIGGALGYLLGLDRGFDIGYVTAVDEDEEGGPEESR